MEDLKQITEIILSVESKLEELIHIVRSYDLNLKIVSNKLNNLIDLVNSVPPEEEVSFHDRTDINSKQVMSVSEEFQLKVENSPLGFRRTSRPETFSGEHVTEGVKATAPSVTISPPIKNALQALPNNQQKPVETGSKVPVIQRIVDGNGKAIFLATIEILNIRNGISEIARTNGVGKWQASLTPGNYRITVKKQESISKPKIELNQEVTINNGSSLQELPVLIIK